jgi:hypothetical protein
VVQMSENCCKRNYQPQDYEFTQNYEPLPENLGFGS